MYTPDPTDDDLELRIVYLCDVLDTIRYVLSNAFWSDIEVGEISLNEERAAKYLIDYPHTLMAIQNIGTLIDQTLYDFDTEGGDSDSITIN